MNQQESEALCQSLRLIALEIDYESNIAGPICRQAADEIERLRGENHNLKRLCARASGRIEALKDNQTP